VPGVGSFQGPNADSAFTSAIRVNADLKAPYEQLIKAGKAPKQAITAVMRKLLILPNALLKKGRKRQPRVA
jgi:transposase